MLRQRGKHDGLGALVGTKNVTRRRHDGFQRAQGYGQGAVRQNLVTKTPARRTRIAKDPGRAGVPQEAIVAL